MRTEVCVVFAWAALGSAAVVKREPQSSGSLYGYDLGAEMKKSQNFMREIAPDIKPTVTKAEPLLRPDAVRKILRFGPHVIPPSKINMPSGGGHGAHGAAPSGPVPTTWEQMTVSQAMTKLTGSPPTLGMPLITVGQIKNLMTSWWSGNSTASTAALRDLIQSPQDPHGWTSHRTFKGSEICQNCTVLRTKSDLVFENGTRVDISHGLYLHHSASLDMGMHMNTNWLNMCPSAQTTFNGVNMQSLIPKELPGGGILSIGAVDEYSQYFTSKDGKVDAGMAVGGDDLVYHFQEVVNYKQYEQKIFVQLDVEYIDGKLGKDASYTSLSFTGCTPSWGFTGNGTSGKITSDPFDVNYPGTVVNSRGHMHDGGTSLDVLLNGKMVCSSRAVYGTKAQMDGKVWTTLSQMTDCTEPFKVKKGDQVRLVVNYDEVAHPKRESGDEMGEEMGFMYFTFVPE